MTQQHDPQEEKRLESVESQLAPEEETEETVDKDEYMSKWGEMANRLSDKAWNWVQIFLGAAFGIGAGMCVYFIQSEGFLPLNFIVALAVVRLGPDFSEKWLERLMPKVRLYMIIVLLAAVIGFCVYLFASGQPFFAE